MPNIHVVDAGAASDDVNALYLDFQRRMGFPAPPNFIKVQGHSLDVARGTWGLVQNVLVGGALPRTLKEMLFTAVSHERKCRYCEAAHLACCRMLGVDDDSLEQLSRNVQQLSPAKVRDILIFGLICARDPQSLTPEDFASLRRHGMTDSEVLEVIAMAGLAVYANIMADATGIEADEMFSSL